MDDVALTTLILDTLGRIPTFHWPPDFLDAGSDQVALFYGPIADQPHRAIGVRVYSAGESAEKDPDGAAQLLDRRVQLHHRGEPHRTDSADALAGVSYLAMKALAGVPGISVVSRSSFSPLGADGNGREERTDNYTIILDNKEVL